MDAPQLLIRCLALTALLQFGSEFAVAQPLPPPGDPFLAQGDPFLPSSPVQVPPTPTFVHPSNWVWQVRPNGTLYHTYWANPHEPRLATHTLGDEDGTFQDSSIGGRVGIVKFGPKGIDQGFQLDVLGGAKLRQDWTNEMSVYAADFRYDILGTWADGPNRWKFGFYHVSAHVGDEFLAFNPGFQRIDYFRDTLVLGYSHNPFPELRLYGEVGWAFHTNVSEPWEIQLGFDYGPAGPTGPWGAPFAAANVHLREELNFGGTLGMQLGWAWRGEQMGDGVLRTGLFVNEGATPHLSFYRQSETQVGWGLWYDY